MAFDLVNSIRLIDAVWLLQGKVKVESESGELRLLVKINSQAVGAEAAKKMRAVKDLKQLSGGLQTPVGISGSACVCSPCITVPAATMSSLMLFQQSRPSTSPACGVACCQVWHLDAPVGAIPSAVGAIPSVCFDPLSCRW